ncbi:MAG: hypothetical protein AAB227_01120 [Pseudomonadota bacterium]
MTFLRETRTTPKSFAKLIGLDADRFERLLSGADPIDPSLAQRMVDATGGALLLTDLIGQSPGAGAIVDLRSRFAADASDIDAEKLTAILAALLPKLIGGARRTGDEHLPRLAADAAAHTYAALSTVTTRRGPDRLIQALQPVFAEILEDLSAPASARRRLQQTSEEAAALYFQAPQQKRRA